MNPFISFCLYVAARVFVQYLKSRPDDAQAGDSLRFLLSAMNVLKRKNPLTESFLIQLDVDLEGLGINKQTYKAVFAVDKSNVSFPNGYFLCLSLIDIARHGRSIHKWSQRCIFS